MLESYPFNAFKGNGTDENQEEKKEFVLGAI